MRLTAVGNYPKIADRPDGQELRRAINRMDKGEITLEELHQVQDEVTREVIREQEEAGLDLLTDGMVRWDDNQTYIVRGLEGFELTGLIRYFDTNTYYRQPLATGPVRWTTPITVRDWEFARSCASKPVKPIVCGPYTLAKLSKTQHHASLETFALELAGAINQELKALEEAGEVLLQVDEPAIVRSANKNDWTLFRAVAERLMDGVKARTLMYTWFGDATGLPGFFELPFDGFGLDFVWGPKNFDLLDEFPKDKELGLGIMDARNVKMETEEYISSTLDKVREYISLDRVYLNPSCGLDYLPRDTAYAKLKRMVEGANAVMEEVG